LKGTWGPLRAGREWPALHQTVQGHQRGHFLSTTFEEPPLSRPVQNRAARVEPAEPVYGSARQLLFVEDRYRHAVRGGLRRHRLKAAWLSVSHGSHRSLDRDQEPTIASREARAQD
jgi:hypothetical protein